MKLRLNSIRFATSEISIFEFARPDNSALPDASPGAHIGIHLPENKLRHYSLINTGIDPKKYLIGVKREDAGRGGSLFLHNNMQVGMEFEIDAPLNNFPLMEEPVHSILIGGGIGITPILSMATRLRDLNKTFDLYYACRSKKNAIFYEELNQFDNVHFHFDDTEDSFFNIKAVVDNAPAGSHLYCCGPGPMLKTYEAATKKMPSERVHLEHFSADIELAADGGYSVVLAKDGREFNIPEGKTILQTLMDAGLDLPFSCEQGICGACETKVLDGTPDHRDLILTDEEQAANNTMMICCSGSKGEKLTLDI